MSKTFAIIAALPREIRGLVEGRKASPAWLRQNISAHWIGRGDAVVVAAGMGSARATRAVEVALEEVHAKFSNPPDDEVFLPDQMLSVGLVGACRAGVRPGDVIVAGQVIDTLTGERFATVDTDSRHVLVSVPAIASVAEKRRLAESYGASIVDMEAATVARLAAMRGIPFRAVKAVSDAHDFELEGLSRFSNAGGSFRTGAFALHTALRPGKWGKAMELGRGSSRALAGLTQALQVLIAES